LVNQELRDLFVADQADRNDHPAYDTLNTGTYASAMQRAASVSTNSSPKGF
jgi:hypothetical protein